MAVIHRLLDLPTDSIKSLRFCRHSFKINTLHSLLMRLGTKIFLPDLYKKSNCYFCLILFCFVDVLLYLRCKYTKKCEFQRVILHKEARDSVPKANLILCFLVHFQNKQLFYMRHWHYDGLLGAE